MARKVFRSGNSAVVSIPPEVLEVMGLQTGDEVTVTADLDRQRIIIMPAALMESLIQNHPFVDGNKRTGLAAAGIMLERKGHRFTADNDQVFDLTMNVARGDIRHKEITRWLEENSERLEAVSSDSTIPQ